MVFPWTYLIVALSAVAVDSQATRTKFSCNGRTSGYYADVSSGCQVYHMCDGLGRQFTYTCPNATLFQQRMLICDHWYMVNCSKSEDNYSANLLIGQREKPFVADSNPYLRTPRPDLLSHPSESELNIIYRTGRAHLANHANVVGANSENSTDTYVLPSHWSTSYSKAGQASTPRSAVKQEKAIRLQGFNSKNNFDGDGGKRRRPFISSTTSSPVNYPSDFQATTPVYPKTVDANTEDPQDLLPPLKFPSTSSKRPPIVSQSVNFESQFEATTPVFPKSVDVNTETPQDLLPPLPYKVPTVIEEDAAPKVNFESKFKATTPVYPKTVDANTEDPQDLLPPLTFENPTAGGPVRVNFESRFKATTPVYPKTVDANTEDPQDLLPPLTFENPTVDSEPVIVNFESKFKATTPVYPKTVDANTEDPENLLPPLPYKVPTILNLDDKPPKVNYQSRFKATTPVYPQSVESTSVPPGDLGILPPEDPSAILESRAQIPSLEIDLLPPPLDLDFKPRNLTDEERIPPAPSKFYQPPKYEPDYTQTENEPVINRDGLKSLNNEQWGDLRKKFLIPDYEFPLEQGTRPSYDSVFSSFQAKNEKKKKK